MADAVTGSGKGFSRVVQRTVFRTKEKVLQNLGKADKTKDDQFDQSLELFNDQQSAAMKFQKELRRYVVSLKEMNVASQNMYRTLKETYEQDWLGYTIVASAFENHCILWDDYLTKMTDVQNSINGYSESFPEIRAKLAKRGRKLTDYDGARHTHEALMNTRKRDEAKISKALDELNEAKSVYELINEELRDELPAFYNSRIAVLASIFNQLCSAEIVFQEESAKVKNSINEVAERLVSDNSYASLPSQPRNLVSISNETRRSSSSSAEQPLKLNNARYQTRLSLSSQTESGSNAKQSNVASSHSTQPLSSLENMLQKSQSKDPNAAGFQLNFVEDSRVKAESPSTISASKDFSDHSSDDGRTDSNCTSAAALSTKPAAALNTKHEDGIYSLARAYDDDELAEYAVPKSNAPVNRPSVVPSERILFKVQATHSYVGEDVDELSFEPGEIITVVPFENPDEQDDGWLMGVKESTREKGVFPENFTARI